MHLHSRWYAPLVALQMRFVYEARGSAPPFRQVMGRSTLGDANAVPRVGRNARGVGDANAVPRVGRNARGVGDANAVPWVGRNAGGVGDADAVPRVGRNAGGVSDADAIPRVGRNARGVGEAPSEGKGTGEQNKNRDKRKFAGKKLTHVMDLPLGLKTSLPPLRRPVKPSMG